MIILVDLHFEFCICWGQYFHFLFQSEKINNFHLIYILWTHIQYSLYILLFEHDFSWVLAQWKHLYINFCANNILKMIEWLKLIQWNLLEISGFEFEIHSLESSYGPVECDGQFCSILSFLNTFWHIHYHFRFGIKINLIWLNSKRKT